MTSWPSPTLKHLCRLTDDCGVIQHAKYWFPDYASGYCVDDNSRALIVAHHHYRLFGDSVSHELIVRYLAFIFYVQRRDGKVRNFIDYTRAFLEEEGSPDSLGRSLWALGHLSTIEEDYLSVPAREMFHRALPHIRVSSAPHALAYALLGLCAYGMHAARHDEAQRLARPFATALFAQYQENRTEEWDWFLPVLTYGNARLSEALLRTGQLLDSAELIEAALLSLQFLNRTLYHDGYLTPVGCRGWYPRDGQCAIFDQQPIDAGGMVEANLLAYQITREPCYRDYAVTAMNWFYGQNILGAPLYNPHSGGCQDGLLARGINSNQGAESTLVYLMAQLQCYEQLPALFASSLPEAPETIAMRHEAFRSTP